MERNKEIEGLLEVNSMKRDLGKEGPLAVNCKLKIEFSTFGHEANILASYTKIIYFQELGQGFFASGGNIGYLLVKKGGGGP